LVVASPDGRHLLSAGLDKTLRQWELETGREVHRIETAGPVLALALSPDGRRAMTGGINKVVQLWDVGSGNELKRVALDNNIVSLAFSPDAQRGLAGLSDATIRLLDLDAGKEVLRLRGHTLGAIRTVAFAPDGLRALSGATTRSFGSGTSRRPELRRFGESERRFCRWRSRPTAAASWPAATTVSCSSGMRATGERSIVWSLNRTRSGPLPSCRTAGESFRLTGRES